MEHTVVVKGMSDGKWVTGCKTGDTSVTAYTKVQALEHHVDEAVEHGEIVAGDSYRAEYIDGDSTTYSNWIVV